MASSGETLETLILNSGVLIDIEGADMFMAGIPIDKLETFSELSTIS